MSNLTVTGSRLLLAGVQRANLVYLTWEPTIVYYRDSAYSWHKSTDGLQWVVTTDPRLLPPVLTSTTVQIHGAGSVKVNAVVVLSAHGDSFSSGLSTGFGPL